MVKIDVGLTPAAGEGDKKAQKKARRSEKKGFKSDRYDAYQKKFHPSQWKKAQLDKAKAGQKEGHRPKEIKFDDSARKEFLTTLHKKKNERRVTAFVDSKRKQAKENAKFRQELKENARQMYNSMASVPILPNYKYKLPTLEETLAAARGAGDSDDDEEYDPTLYENVDHDEAYDRQERKRLAKVAKEIDAKRNQTVFFPMDEGSNNDAAVKKGQKNASGASALDNSGIVVSVEPLFGRRGAPTVSADDEEEEGKGNAKKMSKKQLSMQGSQNLVNSIAATSSLPIDVIKELAKIREETKGPARTEPKLRMMKELEKIRKIKKHSRKGHGKKGGSSKKKNR